MSELGRSFDFITAEKSAYLFSQLGKSSVISDNNFKGKGKGLTVVGCLCDAWVNAYGVTGSRHHCRSFLHFFEIPTISGVTCTM